MMQIYNAFLMCANLHTFFFEKNIFFIVIGSKTGRKEYFAARFCLYHFTISLGHITTSPQM